MKTCKEKAIEWCVSERTLNYYCQSGKIKNAKKINNIWQLPNNAKKPIDNRITNGKYIKKEKKKILKPLPIGISDYIRAQAEYYYVDKTLLIKEFLDRKNLVSLFTRPRRFGKSLNMDMLKVFFEKTDKDTSQYFKDKAIWKCGQKYRKHQGQYPVICLSFKDVKFDSWESTFEKIKDLLKEEYGRHFELAESIKIAEYEKIYYSKIMNGEMSEVELVVSLEKLSHMLTQHYGKAPIIIIDEYDTPIQEGYTKNFYDEIIDFMRNFFSGAFKDNKNLSYGFLTGIFRIAQESIFSGMNNLIVNSLLDYEYDSFFGFTEYEVKEMLIYYNYPNKENELKSWYDGYLFGNTEIYNPWSVINYISRGCVPQPYWVNTGKNEIFDDFLTMIDDEIEEGLYSLLQDNSLITKIDQNVIYKSLSDDPTNIYSLLFVAGYLKASSKQLQADGSYLCEVSIPNKEISFVYKNEIMTHLLKIGAVNKSTANKITKSIYTNDPNKLQESISEYIKNTVSFYDAGTEGFYHGLILGLVALLDVQYIIKSNRESGNGRYDISLYPKNKKLPGIIMELKLRKDLNNVELEKASDEALSQIDRMKYDADMVEDKINTIIKYGIAFSGKNVVIKTK